MSWLQDPVHRTLAGALDGLARRESLIAANLANIDTPGYVPQSVPFEGALQAALAEARSPAGQRVSTRGGPGSAAPGEMRRTDPRHMVASRPPSAARGTTGDVPFAGSIRNDGNRADLESEMAALADTQLRFAAVGRLTTGRLAMLRDAITGGR